MSPTTLIAALALALPVAAPPAQEPVLPPRPGDALGGNDPQAEMRELFRKVELALREIDLFLQDAAAGEVPLVLPEESGLDDLLRNTMEQSQSAVRDIERLLEIAEQQAQGGGGGGGQQEPQPSDGQSPLDEQRNRTQQPEATPERPEQGQDPSDSQSRGQQPEDGGANEDEDPENREGSPPPGGEGERGPRGADEGDRWGELPPRVREVFRSQGGGELPVQYRDWIDSYYRRLNRRAQ